MNSKGVYPLIYSNGVLPPKYIGVGCNRLYRREGSPSANICTRCSILLNNVLTVASSFLYVTTVAVSLIYVLTVNLLI